MFLFACYVCATLQNSAHFTTIPENFRLKKTLENTDVYSDKEV